MNIAMKSTLKTVLIAALSGFAGAFVFGLIRPAQENYYTQTNSVPVEFSSNRSVIQLADNEDFVMASAASTSSVVYITTVSQQQYNHFDWYFNWGQPNQVVSSGSGVIFTQDGYIVTNHHVINNAEKIEVTHDKRVYTAKLIGTDPSTDLAVLKIEATGLPAIQVGTSQNLKIGEWVLAVGNPFNLTSTVTAGIVSAKARNINVVNSQFPIESFIQTDAAINPGNSGGALVNIKGELVGINTAILSKTGSYTGYGFAVPVDIVKKVVNDLIKYGEVQKAFFGANVVDITQVHASKLSLDNLNGVIVTSVEKDSYAEKAGIKTDYVIVKVNEYDVKSKSNFDEYLSYYSPGEKIKITYNYQGKTEEVTVTLTNREGTTGILKREIYYSESLGATFESISKVEKDKLGIDHGVRVVKPGRGLIARLGLQEGFVITAINNTKVNTGEDVADILEKIRGKVIIEGVLQNGTKGYYTFIF